MTQEEIKEAICWCNTFADINGNHPNHKIMKRCVEALKKQVPMKFDSDDSIYCPRCDTPLPNLEFNDYCPSCGQRLDWGEVDG